MDKLGLDKDKKTREIKRILRYAMKDCGQCFYYQDKGKEKLEQVVSKLYQLYKK